jgi:putative endonuclease
VSRNLGEEGEALAAEYLRGEGCEILHRRYRLGRGDIDIIARDGRTVIFVEVKTRASRAYGEPEESVTAEKVRRIRRIASAFLARHRLSECDCRIDIVGVTFERGRPVFRHTRDIAS